LTWSTFWTTFTCHGLSPLRRITNMYGTILLSTALLDRFQIIVSQGDDARGKPNPDTFLKAAEQLGVAPALCLALEDSYNGVRAPSNQA
jgi:beta-phosphoglucomutase-like phosphatase (HAD superfamily)